MSKTNVFYSEYDGESIIDMLNDIQSSFGDDAIKDIPTDKYGIMKGKFRVEITWCGEDDCDCEGLQHNADCPHWVLPF